MVKKLDFILLFIVLAFALALTFFAPLTDTFVYSSHDRFALVTDLVSNTPQVILKVSGIYALGNKVDIAILALLSLAFATTFFFSIRSRSKEFSVGIVQLFGIALVLFSIYFTFGINFSLMAGLLVFSLLSVPNIDRGLFRLGICLVALGLFGPSAVFPIFFAICLDWEDEAHSRTVNFYLKPFIIVISTLTICFIWPSDSFPTYPQNAQLIPGYGSPYGTDSFVGFGSNRPFLNLESIHLSYFSLSIVLAAYTLMLFIGQKISKTSSTLTLLIFLSVALGSYCINSFYLSPITTIARAIPNLTFTPYLLVSLGIAVILLARELIVSKRFIELAVLCGLILSLHPLPEKYLGSLANLKIFSDQEERMLSSPSLFVAKKAIIGKLPTYAPVLYAQVTPTNIELRSSHSMGDLHRINKSPEGWSSSQGKQLGNEWIEITFSDSVEADGLDLSLSKRFTDFPRGVRVLGGKNCNEKILFEDRRWLGSIGWSQEQLPFYTHQSQIVLPFSERTQLNCIRIEQTGKESHFDWSVEKIELLTAPR